MLFALTSIADFLGGAASLWVALYLPARGLPRRASWRAVGLLLCTSGLLQWGYISLYRPAPNGAAVRAVLLILLLALLNDLAGQALVHSPLRRHRWRSGAIYLLAALTALVLLASPAALARQAPAVLHVTRSTGQPLPALYASFLIGAAASILFSLWLGSGAGSRVRGWHFGLASLFLASFAMLELAGLLLPARVPRLAGDVLLLGTVLMAVSTSRAAAPGGRIAVLRDVPIAALTASCLLLVYVLMAWQLRVSPIGLSLVALVAILTHSVYDRVREALDRQKDAGRVPVLPEANDAQRSPAAVELEAGFVSEVEQGLRNLTDCISLGRSELPAKLGISEKTHIHAGRVVQQRLLRAIEALRPVGEVAREPLPRACYSYVVLHDAYWQGVPNREIMSRLNISEGTFHRTRRAAVRAVARSLLEAGPPSSDVPAAETSDNAQGSAMLSAAK